MYKVTHEGKTIVGNNEDWFSPNSQIWFIPSDGEKYGVMHVGFINGFPQGGINEAGLMFDGFAMPYLAVNNTEGKTKVPLGEAITYAMQHFANVEAVKKYLLSIDLSDLATGMVVFVDKKGDYLIVEGDELIIGKETEQIFSNFYPSQEEAQNVSIPFYQNGLAFVNTSEGESSFSYCSAVMDNMKQNITQYSTIYDLETLTIRVYYFQNLEDYQEIDLKEKLKKGKHKLSIPDLFPENKKGMEYFSIYNDVKNPTHYLKAMFDRDYGHLSGNRLAQAKEGFAQYLNIIGYEWLNDKKEIKGAIAIFEYGTHLIPNNANLFDSLGEAYLRDENYKAAINNYEKSLMLNPKNENAIEVLGSLKKE